MKKLLWIDDLRNPFINKEGKCPEGFVVEWVLNYGQFIEWIEKFGLPYAISFDHDLADYQEDKEYTGMDCAKWLIEHCLETGEKMPKFFVHSANTVGADNILYLLKNYLKCVE